MKHDRTVTVSASLIRRAIRIIEEDRETAFESYRVPGTDTIPNADERAEVRRYDQWLYAARKAL